MNFQMVHWRIIARGEERSKIHLAIYIARNIEERDMTLCGQIVGPDPEHGIPSEHQPLCKTCERSYEKLTRKKRNERCL